jgi:hypothetical protein
VCSELSAADLLAGKACRLGAPNGESTVVVWGDSHADSLMSAFDRLGASNGQAVLYLGKIGCAPLLDVELLDLPFGCKAYNDAARRLIAESGAARVVLVARWSHYTHAPTYRHEERIRVVLTDAQSTRAAIEDNGAVLARGLERTLDFLAPRQVYVVATVPEIGYRVPEALAQAYRLPRPLDIRPTLEEYRERQSEVAALLLDAGTRHDFTMLDPTPLLCATGRCQVEQGGRPMYFDEHHLSNSGAQLLVPLLEPVFRQP